VVASDLEEQSVLSPEQQITQKLIAEAQQLNFHHPENLRTHTVIYAISNIL
jgi:hypothetical protein